MNKSLLRKRLVKAGLSEEVIDERLKSISDETLKSFDGIPDAEILKQFNDEDPEEDQDEVEDDVEEEDDDDDAASKELKDKEQVFVLDPAVLKEFAKIANSEAEKVLTNLLEGATLETESSDEVTKEVEAITELKEQVEALTDAVNSLLDKDEERLKELYADAPRGSALRISRFKQAVKKPAKVTADDVDEEEASPIKRKKEAGIMGADGKVSANMTEFVIGTGTK